MKKNIGVQMNNIDKIYQKCNTVSEFSKSYFGYLKLVLDNIKVNQVDDFVNALLVAREKDASIFFIGNGGSAATATHFANDIAIGTRSSGKPFRAQSLCDNQAIITAISNDDGYQQVFSKQLEVLAKKGDLVIFISASGNSPSIIHAIKTASKKGAKTIGLSAFDGGEMKKLVDISLHIPTQKGEYGPAEDAHMIIDHLVSNYLMRYVSSNK